VTTLRLHDRSRGEIEEFEGGLAEAVPFLKALLRAAAMEIGETRGYGFGIPATCLVVFELKPPGN